jgi:CheY-like chemotaxis protein
MTSTQQERTSVLLAHASATVRQHLRTQLEADPAIRVTEAETGGMALDLFFQHRPAVALIDICLPDRNGFDVLRCLREACPGCQLFLISRSLDPFPATVGRLIAAAETFCELDIETQMHSLLKKIHLHQACAKASRSEPGPSLLNRSP